MLEAVLEDEVGTCRTAGRKGHRMTEYTMRSDYATYVAMDQHARSVTVRALDLTTGEARGTRLANAPTAEAIVSWAKAWATPPMLFAYESGPCGFHLARSIAELGCDCDVIAVSSIARSSEDKLLKDDKRDADRLLAEVSAASPRCKRVWIPDAQSEGARDAVRGYYDALADAKRAKQRTSGLLLRYGHVWNERTKRGGLRKTWTPAWLKWARGAELPSEDARTQRDFYIECALDAVRRTGRALEACGDIAGRRRWKPYVDALCRLKGVGVVTALAFCATVDDFSRFPNGRSVSSYFGLVPGRHDSGPKTLKSARITKAGDATVRRSVIEGLASLRGFGGGAKPLAAGCAVSEAVESEARKCNARHAAKYRRLVEAKKGANLARTAVAAELVRAMWVLGSMVQRELGAAE